MIPKNRARQIGRALARTAPNDVADVLSRCTEKGSTTVKKTTPKKWIMAIAACLAVILIGSGLFYRQAHTVASVVSLDVNPSIELEVTRNEKVLRCTALNDDAKRVLAELDGGAELTRLRCSSAGEQRQAMDALAAKLAQALPDIPAEDARYLLPNACETKMVVTMNARSLQNFFHLRCCSRAQWEIRAVADEMLRLVYPLAPHVFAAAGPRCLGGPCPEGGMCCGKQNAVRDKYATLKQEAENHG